MEQMRNFTSYLIICLIAFWSLCFLVQATTPTPTPTPASTSLTVPLTKIGAILAQTSRSGKEAKVSIEIAIQEFNIKTNRSSVLYLQDSLNKPLRAAIAAKELIDEHGVNVILGGRTWEEASAIAEVIGEADHDHSPLFLSLAYTTPLQATNKWPFLVQVVLSQSTPMNAVAAMLQSWDIRQVTLIYETSNLASSSSSVISHLSQAFQQTGCELTLILPLSSGSSCFVNKELEVLKRQKRQVFIIHTSLELGICLFQTAKKMDMTGDGYLWIATNEITDLFHSINPTVISSLKGMVGVKSYLPENTRAFLDFRRRFRQKFRSDYPEEEEDEPGIFAVQGYSAMKLLERDSPEKLHNWRPREATSMEIVSVIGKGYHSVYWTQGIGFCETDIDEETTYTHSINDVLPSLWPRKRWYVHEQQHWDLVERMKNWFWVGIRACLSLLKQFGEVEDGSVSGFVGTVFGLITRYMNPQFKYCFRCFKSLMGMTCFRCLKSLMGMTHWIYGCEGSGSKKSEKRSEL